MLIEVEKGFEPNVKDFLLAVDDTRLFHDAHQLKHPLAIYNTSLAKIENDLAEFFEITKR